MGAMGCVMGVCAIVSAFASAWPTPMLLLLYALFGASAIGWNGVYLAEVAQRAPAGAVSAATAAALFVTFAGVLAGPPVFALMIEGGMSYGMAFTAVGLPALLGGVALLRGAKPASPRPGRQVPPEAMYQSSSVAVAPAELGGRNSVTPSM
jgi:MFS family permease